MVISGVGEFVDPILFSYDNILGTRWFGRRWEQLVKISILGPCPL